MKDEKRWGVLGVLTIVLGFHISLVLPNKLSMINDDFVAGIISLVIFLFCMTVSIFLFIKYEKEARLKNERIEKERLHMLEEKYSMYVSLVNKIQAEQSKKLNVKDEKEMEKYAKLSFSKDNDYLILFEKYLNVICENLIKGKPDTFIVATCLMYSLINKPRLISLIDDDKAARLLDNPVALKSANMMVSHFNCVIALDVALKLISEPITYYEDEKGECIEQKHPKVDIIVPEGIIEKSPLYSRICGSITNDHEVGEDFSIIQFSNLLHLIYLNCKK